ncbi:MAG: glycosyl hydrolase family 18 protein [Verrucomicrobiae bacterium]|jgi:hypothetical protein|nr:glycosyl hydrolase family 18 protein [Verrucomicrobiae bacterium]
MKEKTIKNRFALHSFLCLCGVLTLFSLAQAKEEVPTPSGTSTSSLKDLPIEHSVWVEDWTANLDTDTFISALPQGVNTIHVFVGQLALVNGEPSINGFTLDTPDLKAPKASIKDPYLCLYKEYLSCLGEKVDDITSMKALLRKTSIHEKIGDLPTIRLAAPAGSGAFPNIEALKDFVTRTKASGVVVKLSIGGQSGTNFGNSWQLLTENNISGFAQALVALCQTTGADGVDFDEELEDTTIATLAGKLAGAFKSLNSYLITSYCVYGGCDTSGPWHPTNTTFLQNAVTSQGWCAIDRVYVMTYYDGCSIAQNEGFMTSWITWLGTQHGFTASRISAGVDPNDPTTSTNDGSLNTWIQFAASQGLSTAIWDQFGVSDYVNNNWGIKITDIYNN